MGGISGFYFLQVSVFSLLLSFKVVSGGSVDTTVKLPELQLLSPSRKTFPIDRSILYSSDSARIIFPKIRNPLQGGSTSFEILPKCSVDSVVLYVRHSATKADTVARLKVQPYRAIWNYSNLPDQDQIHLQFGYKMYHPAGKIITAKAMPHYWVIDRKPLYSRKKYHCREIRSVDSIVVDGILDEWKHVKRAPIGETGQFALKWDDKKLYFAAEIRSDGISPATIVELHLDPFRTRSTFSDSTHRSIRFSPSGRSYCFVNHKKDSSTYTQCDSIAALLTDGMVSRVIANDYGYCVEASLPFYAISDLSFPRLVSGMEVTCRGGNGSFASWAGCGEYNRYNPSEWGTLVLHQTMLPLKIVFIVAIILVALLCLVSIIKGIYHSFASKKIEKEELRGSSPLMRIIQESVDKNLSDRALSIHTIAVDCGIDVSLVERTLSDELECDIVRFIDFNRIKRVKQELWNFSRSFENIANICGYPSLKDMNEKFEWYLHTSPESYRLQAMQMASEEDDVIMDVNKKEAGPDER